MKRLILPLLLSPFCFSALATGTGTAYQNTDLGFQIHIPAHEKSLSICNKIGSCYSFKLRGSQKGSTHFQEEQGLCAVTLESVSKDHRSGNTQDEFMLVTSYQVLKVTQGEERCRLATEHSGLRSLTGVYQ